MDWNEYKMKYFPNDIDLPDDPRELGRYWANKARRGGNIASGKTIKHKINIPIYGATLYIVVTDDLDRERKAMENLLGPYEDKADLALASYNFPKGNFAMFFLHGQITIITVAHEVFHITHRLLEWIQANFDEDHHEQGAILHGYLLDLTMAKLKMKR